MTLREIQEQEQQGYYSKLRKPKNPKLKANGNYACLMCSNDLEPQYAYHGMYLCGRCADFVANTYSYCHGGKFVNWDNSRFQNPNAKKKKKISHELKKKVFERDEYRCKHCGTHLDLCADHIKPESWGGETTLENLQTLCRSCNSKKNNRYEG